MLTLKYLLEIIGFALLIAAAAMMSYDLYRRSTPRWRAAGRLAAIAAVPLLLGLSIQVVPSGMAAVRVSQISGTLPGTLYPGPKPASTITFRAAASRSSHAAPIFAASSAASCARCSISQT